MQEQRKAETQARKSDLCIHFREERTLPSSSQLARRGGEASIKGKKNGMLAQEGNETLVCVEAAKKMRGTYSGLGRGGKLFSRRKVLPRNKGMSRESTSTADGQNDRSSLQGKDLMQEKGKG